MAADAWPQHLEAAFCNCMIKGCLRLGSLVQETMESSLLEPDSAPGYTCVNLGGMVLKSMWLPQIYSSREQNFSPGFEVH